MYCRCFGLSVKSMERISSSDISLMFGGSEYSSMPRISMTMSGEKRTSKMAIWLREKIDFMMTERSIRVWEGVES